MLIPSASDRMFVKDFFSSRVFVVALCVLATVDVGFILTHIGHKMSVLSGTYHPLGDRLFNIEVDGSYGEYFEYVKIVICIVATSSCFLVTKRSIYSVMSVAYVWLLLDNSIGLHEGLGRRVAPLLPGTGALPLPGEALGELAVFASFALAGLGLFAVSWRHSVGKHRVAGAVFVLLMAALGVFAVGVDALHAVSERFRQIVTDTLGVVEDGGELLVLSVHCAFTLALWAKLRRANTAALPATPAENWCPVRRDVPRPSVAAGPHRRPGGATGGL